MIWDEPWSLISKIISSLSAFDIVYNALFISLWSINEKGENRIVKKALALEVLITLIRNFGRINSPGNNLIITTEITHCNYETIE